MIALPRPATYHVVAADFVYQIQAGMRRTGSQNCLLNCAHPCPGPMQVRRPTRRVVWMSFLSARAGALGWSALGRRCDGGFTMEGARMLTTSSSLSQATPDEALRASPIPALRKLRVEETEGAIILS